MPRYSSINVQDIRILENTVSVTTEPAGIDFSSIYKNLPSDLALSWNNDLVFDTNTEDYKISQHLLGYVQRLFLSLITQRGSNPESPTFGWDYRYLIDQTDIQVKQLLPLVVEDVKKTLEQDPDTLRVISVEASLVKYDNQTSYILIDIKVQPKISNNIIQAALKVT